MALLQVPCNVKLKPLVLRLCDAHDRKHAALAALCASLRVITHSGRQKHLLFSGAGITRVICRLSWLIARRRAACTSPLRRRWELCAEPLQFTPDWSHARCGWIRAKQKDTREGRKPQQRSGLRDCVKSDEEKDEEAVRTLLNFQTRRAPASQRKLGCSDDWGGSV